MGIMFISIMTSVFNDNFNTTYNIYPWKQFNRITYIKILRSNLSSIPNYIINHNLLNFMIKVQSKINLSLNTQLQSARVDVEGMSIMRDPFIDLGSELALYTRKECFRTNKLLLYLFITSVCGSCDHERLGL